MSAECQILQRVLCNPQCENLRYRGKDETFVRKMIDNAPLEVSIVWFKKDFRIHDHAPLATAAESSQYVLPLYVFESDYWVLPDTSRRQFDFLYQSVQELNLALADLGQPLVVRVGSVLEALDELSNSLKVTSIHCHEETGNLWTYERDEALRSWCTSNRIPLIEHSGTGVVRRLKSRDGWAANWNKRMAAPLFDAPKNLQRIPNLSLGDLGSACQIAPAGRGCRSQYKGGRSEGLSLLDSFLSHRGHKYSKEMSSPNTAFNSCSRLSTHIAHGTLSLKEIVHQTKGLHQSGESKFKSKEIPKRSLSSFKGRLHWHCHFIQKMEDQPNLEESEIHKGFAGIRSTTDDTGNFESWKNGNTGFPFLDATMRCLNATGWMNFRMRAMLVSFASYNLWHHWRDTGLHLARAFTDYEPGIHWSQVQMQSGCTGINSLRIYNPIKQGYDQDPEGDFIYSWVPELKDVPKEFIHEPWKWERFGRYQGFSYPERIVDHIQTSRQAREKIWEVRKRADVKAESRSVMKLHGSRKRRNTKVSKASNISG